MPGCQTSSASGGFQTYPTVARRSRHRNTWAAVPSAELPTEASAAHRDRQGVRSQRSEPGRRRQSGGQTIRIRRFVGGQPHHVEVPVTRLDLAAKPTQERGLAVAAGAGEDRVPGRALASVQIGEQVQQLAPLRIPAGQIRGNTPAPRNERIGGRSVVHGARIANPRNAPPPRKPEEAGTPSRGPTRGQGYRRPPLFLGTRASRPHGGEAPAGRECGRDARVPRTPCPHKRLRGVKSASNPLVPLLNRGRTPFLWGDNILTFVFTIYINIL